MRSRSRRDCACRICPGQTSGHAWLTDRARVVFLSHFTSATAPVFPIKRIVAETRARGI